MAGESLPTVVATAASHAHRLDDLASPWWPDVPRQPLVVTGEQRTGSAEPDLERDPIQRHVLEPTWVVHGRGTSAWAATDRLI